MSWNGFGGLDLSGVDAEQGRKTLTPGAHPCKITGAEIKQTGNGDGHGLKVAFAALDGSGETSDFINLNNRNAKAVEIGQRRLKALLIAAKHPNPDRPGDVKTMIGLRVGVHVEQDADWTDKDGVVRPGGGKPRRSGAYYELDGAQAGSPPSPGGDYDDLNDSIPF